MGFGSTCRIKDKTIKALEKKDDKDKSDDNDKNDDNDKKDNKDKEGSKDKNNKDKKAKPACTMIKTTPIAVDGVVRHTTAWIPVRCFAEIAGAQKGDICRLLSYEMNTDESKNNRIALEEDNPYTQESESIGEPHYIKGIIQKDLIKISVTVKRQ